MARKTRNTNRKQNKKTILKRMQSKLYVVFILLCILFVVLVGRLMYIEYTSGEKYEKIVLSQQSNTTAALFLISVEIFMTVEVQFLQPALMYTMLFWTARY